jgi:hypothetical protein
MFMQETIENKNIWLNHQKEYQQAGYSVIPGKYQSKMPAIKNWSEYCYRMPTVDEVMSWSTNFSETNLDLALGEASGVVALDLDCVDEKILEVIMPLLPESPVVKVGSKGETRFFRYTGFETTDSLKFNGEMVVEILGPNKKTTIPPSRHPNGATYRWATESNLLNINKDALPILPPALLSTLGDRLRAAFPDAEQQSYGRIRSGRNDELSSLVGKLIKENKTVPEAVTEMLRWDEENNDPPLFTDQNEFRHTEPVSNALMFYANHLNTINNRHYRDNKEYEVPLCVVKDDDGKKSLGQETKSESTKSVSEIMSLAPIAIQNLHTTLLNNSWIRQPNLALGAVLTLVSTLISRKVVFQGLSPNLYVLNISPSGTGKDKPQQFVKEILINLRADSLLGAGDYVSDASLMDGLATKPVRLDIMDEAGGILRSVNSGKSEYNGKMADVLAELYTSSNTKYLGRSTAEGNKGACYRPNVNILASTTPTGFSEGVSRKAIEKGLMGRFLVFLGDGEAKAQRLRSFPTVPGSTMDQLNFWLGFKPDDFEDSSSWEIGGVSQAYVDLKATKAAEDLLDSYFEEFDALRRKTDKMDPLLPIIARLYQQMVKLVIVSASMRTVMNVPLITDKDVQFGYELIKFYFGTISEVVDRYVFENKVQMNSQKILNLIKDAGGSMSKQNLFKASRSLTKREREQILEDLVHSNMVAMELDQEQGVVYTLKDIE